MYGNGGRKVESLSTPARGENNDMARLRKYFSGDAFATDKIDDLVACGDWTSQLELQQMMVTAHIVSYQTPVVFQQKKH